VYGLVHSILAWPAVKAWMRRRAGASFERWYRLAYNLFAALSLLPALVLAAWLPDRYIYTIPSPWMFLTLTGQALAVLVMAVGLLQTGVLSFLGLRQVLQSPETVRRQTLIKGGLYRWIRHPLYTAGLVFIWLVPVMTFNLLALNLGITIYIIVGAKYEERKMLRQFGQEYADYQSHTWMLIPGLF
jgi:protein-S-isoprenylcysteine O-methyltransferase Ste14